MQHLLHLQFRGIPRARAAPAARPAAADSTPPGGLLAPYVLSRAGLHPECYRALPLRRRVPACLRAVGAGSETEAIARIERNPALQQAALGALLIGVSEFFRDPPVFESLSTMVVPALRAPRVASVGCSTGAELYSVAILLAEAGTLHGAELLGADCRPDAIAAARTGTFAPAELTHVGPERLTRYFERTASGFRVARGLRDRTAWMVGDMTQGLVAGRFDLVLCRNLTIYLQHPVAERLVNDLARALAPGGVLVVGKAERPPAVLGLTQIARCVYRRPHA